MLPAPFPRPQLAWAEMWAPNHNATSHKPPEHIGPDTGTVKDTVIDVSLSPAYVPLVKEGVEAELSVPPRMTNWRSPGALGSKLFGTFGSCGMSSVVSDAVAQPVTSW